MISSEASQGASHRQQILKLLTGHAGFIFRSKLPVSGVAAELAGGSCAQSLPFCHP